MTYTPGTRLTVGSHDVEIIKKIGEGGFAHVYTVTTSPKIPNHDVCCLKRVQVPTKAYLNLLRAEVDAMQRLINCPNIVQIFDSHAERMRGALGESGQYEVFVLMEFCSGGGLIDFMNKRLRDQLREHEILKIMYDITLGLSQMHYLNPPLLHRDLKIENVLIGNDGSFKLCDFGSVSPVLRPPQTPEEFQILQNDINHQTTVQYRAPEMVHITQINPINEKSDIWALGVFLYKLCYYTTPFERPNQTLEQFQQLILAGAFTIPPRPAYSERLRNMIRVLLQTDPHKRPNVFQVMQEVSEMRKVKCPIAPRQLHRVQSAPLPNALPLAPVGAPAVTSTTTQVSTPVPVPQQQQQQQPASTNSIQTAMTPSHSQSLSPVSSAPIKTPQSQSPTLPARRTLAVPASPVVAPSSPNGSDDLATRFPSLEEIDKMTTKAPSRTRSAPLAPSTANSAQSKPAQPQKPVQPKPASRSMESDSLVNFDPPQVAPIHKILDKIDDRSSTVVLEESNLSSVDFLKTLNPEKEKRQYYDSDDSDDRIGHDLYGSSDDDDDEPEIERHRHFKHIVKPFHRRKASFEVRPVVRMSTKPSIKSKTGNGNNTGAPVPPQHTKPIKARPKSAIFEHDLIDSEDFKPRNSIQQRVHHFLSSHDRQHPPVRTAKGYGKFTDDTFKERSKSSGDINSSP